VLDSIRKSIFILYSILHFVIILAALDEGSHYEMDDKLLGLLYTSTNGLIDIVSSDLSLYEDECLEEVEAGLPRSVGKRKFSNDRLTFPSSIRDTSNMDKKRRMD
jgi:hypothetical protein